MQNWRQKGREGSVWNLFQNKATINNDLKDILDEVVSVRKACMSSRASMLEILQIKERDETFMNCNDKKIPT